mgnify:CR=1 FL=1
MYATLCVRSALSGRNMTEVLDPYMLQVALFMLYKEWQNVCTKLHTPCIFTAAPEFVAAVEALYYLSEEYDRIKTK